MNVPASLPVSSWRALLPVLLVTILQALTTLLSPQDGADHLTTVQTISAALYSIALPALAILTSVPLLGIRFSQFFNESRLPLRSVIRQGIEFGAGMTLLLLAFSSLLSWILKKWGIEVERQSIFSLFSHSGISSGVRIFLMVDAVFLAPVLEEAMYRGILFGTAFRPSRRFWSSALLTGTYFALMHLHGPSFLPLVVFSVCVSGVCAATGSLLPSIVMHILFNAVSLLLFLAS